MKKTTEKNNAFCIKLVGDPGNKKLEIVNIPTIQIGNQVLEEKDNNLHFSGNLVVDGDVYVDGQDKPVEPGAAIEVNPEEEATEALTKIKIDGVVYSVEGGSGDLDELMQEEF